VLTGLPQWASNLEERPVQDISNEDYDDYDDILKDDLSADNQNLLMAA